MSARVIASGLTADRTFAFPDANGTIVVTGSSPSFTLVQVGDGLVGTPSVAFSSHTNDGLFSPGSGNVSISVSGVEQARWNTTSCQTNGNVNTGGTFGFSSSGIASAVDLILARDAANTLAQRNGTNAQTFNIYKTYTDASNYTRGFLTPSGASLVLGSLGAGTGASGITSILLQPNGTNVLTAGATGFGYPTGIGGAVTQLTSRTTTVILNNVTGDITLFSAAGSATAASFTVTNSNVAATDNIIINQKSGTNLYNTIVTTVGAGSFVVTFYTTGGTATDAPVFHFSVIKGVNA